jgi:hypothetical protein
MIRRVVSTVKLATPLGQPVSLGRRLSPARADGYGQFDLIAGDPAVLPLAQRPIKRLDGA